LLEKQLQEDKADGKLSAAWDALDVNANGLASLAEVDK
jgi:hypothetical protein